MTLFYNEGKWSSERLGDLSEDIQLTIGRVCTQNQILVFFSQALELGSSQETFLGLSTLRDGAVVGRRRDQ